MGSSIEFARQPLDFCLKAAQEFGDICTFRMGTYRWYLLNRPDYIWEVLVNRAACFHKPKLNKRIFRLFLGNGLVSSDGEYWKRQHRMVMPGFHRERIDAYAEIMVRYTHEMLDGWTEGETRDIADDTTGLTLAIVAKTLFDADVKGEARMVGECMEVISDVLVQHINKPLPTPRWWPSKSNRRKLKAIEDMTAVVLRIIEERRASGEDRGDLLSMLVRARDEDGGGMTDLQLKEETMTLFFAGHETTSLALAWMWYLLARQPEITQRLQGDIDDQTAGRRLTLEDLAALPYLEQVIKESLRFLPSVWCYMREPIEDFELDGYVLEKGSAVFISPYVTQHDARFFPEPDVFRPERFTEENEKLIPKGAYVPFAAGPRVCLGKNFAMMELKLLLASMLQRANPVVPEDFEAEFLPQLALRPKHGLPIQVQLRQPPAIP